MAFSSSVRDPAIAEMNMTPLVDVMLVLLVIFMVSAPMLTRNVHATLPQAAPPSPLKPMQLQVAVGSDGSYRLDDRPLGKRELWERLEVAVAADPQVVLRVRASGDADYQGMVTVLSEARARGIANIGLQP